MARFAFVQNGYYEMLSFAYLSAVLKKAGHETELFIGHKEGELASRAAEWKPDAVCVTCQTGYHRWYLDFAARMKERRPETLTFFGGPHPTFFPQMLENPQVDLICVGEGEGAVLDVAEAIETGGGFKAIPNVGSKVDGQMVVNPVRPLIADLDSVPYPDWPLYYKKYPFLSRRKRPLISSRGCPYQCTYCFNPGMDRIYKKEKVLYARRRSAGSLLDEMERLEEHGAFTTLFFQDDTFNLDKKWVVEFCEAYAKRFSYGLSAICIAHLFDEEMTRAMKAANFKTVYFGLESGDEEFRLNTLKRPVKDKHLFRAAELLHGHGISFKTYNLIGMPGETLEQAFKTVELNIKIRAPWTNCYLYQPYPKTELGEIAEKMGLFDGDYDKLGRSYLDRAGIQAPGYHKFVNLQKFFIVAVKWPWTWPLIKKLVALPNNRLFNAIFFASFTYNLWSFEELRLRDALQLGLRNFASLFAVGDRREKRRRSGEAPKRKWLWGVNWP